MVTVIGTKTAYPWLPLLGGVLVLFVALVALRINGSSSTFWYYDLHDLKNAQGALLGSPKPTRSDEWMVWTPAILAQLHHHPSMPVENPSLGAGTSPLLMSLPVRHYTMLSRPQLWGFFFLDTERGFSWYWNFKVFGLLAAFYLLLLVLTRGRSDIAILGSIAISYSSFVQWWFSSPPMLPEMLASWAVALVCGWILFQPAAAWKKMGASLVLVACVINFVLCCYPPFEIPLIYLGAALFAAFLWTSRRSPTHRGWIWTGACGFAAVALLWPVFLECRSTLEILAHTSYPGTRRHHGGGMSFAQFFGGLMNFFDGEREHADAYANTSEAGNFLPLWILAMMVLLLNAWEKRFVRRDIGLPLARTSSLLVALGFFILFLGTYALFGFPGWLAQITGLGFSTESRSLIGIGIAGMIFAFLSLHREEKPLLRSWYGAGAAVLIILSAAVYVVGSRAANPIFLTTTRSILLASVATGLGVSYLLLPARVFGCVLCAALLYNNFLVNPISQGLPSLLESAAARKIAAIYQADPEAGWAAYERSTLPQFVLASGAHVLNGVKIVPPLELLRQIDVSGASREIYNRYAYIVFRLPRPGESGPHFESSTPDSYRLFISPTDPALRAAGLKYVVFRRVLTPEETTGLTLLNALPESQMWIYKLL